MQTLISYTAKFLRSKKSKLTPGSTRSMSQSTSIPKKQQRVRDHGFDDYMEVEKKLRKVLKFQDLIQSQLNSMISASRFDILSRRLGFKQFEAQRFILKYPQIFDVFEHPVQRILYIRLSGKAIRQIHQENESLTAQIPEAVTRLRKLLMLSNTGKLSLDHVRIASREFGLPDDFEFSVILKYPQFFRLFEVKETKTKYIEIVERDSSLAVCAIEKVREKEYREKGLDAEDIRFSFIVNFPPGFKISKYYKIAVWKWQRLPYWSPYEDVSGYDMRSLESQKRMEKRGVAMVHELVSLTVEKKISLERIAHFRLTMDLPKKLKEFLLQHQGIFYISTRGNQGKLHTIFLREAYKKGELVEPNDLYLARRRLMQLIMMRLRKCDREVELSHYRRGKEDIDRRRIDGNCPEDRLRTSELEDNVGHNGESKEEPESDIDNGAEYDYMDGDSDCSESVGVGHNGESKEEPESNIDNDAESDYMDGDSDCRESVGSEKSRLID